MGSLLKCLSFMMMMMLLALHAVQRVTEIMGWHAITCLMASWSTNATLNINLFKIFSFFKMLSHKN
jgi:hypothetical protein